MTTHTYVKLEVSDPAYKEISDKLRAAGYHHAFMDDGTIDMHGIGIDRYDTSTENVKAHLNAKLNEAVDKLAADNGITREELLTHARNLLDQHSQNRLRSELKNTHEDK